MCDEGAVPGADGVHRRTVLTGAAALAAAAWVGARNGRAAGASLEPADASANDPALLAPVPVAPGLAVFPRDAWGADLPPRGALAPERPQFLLVHHTASSSGYAHARDVIRGVYAFQTGAAKRWPDVCYEFFVGHDGDVWEGRAGSLAGPVVADASGGSQGFAQLVCLLGDFTGAPPTDAALDALVHVLAWLAGRDGIDVSPGASTTFVSRGSDRWAAGVSVTTSTIAGHRDMTYTECPGDDMYVLLPDVRTRVHALRATWDAATGGDTAPRPDGLRPARRLGVVHNP